MVNDKYTLYMFVCMTILKTVCKADLQILFTTVLIP